MAFKGAVGVSIVIVSLFASAILGVLINVNQTDVLKDVDHYQSDITGLYKSSAGERTYVEYNTAKNYNGYSSNITNDFPVDFEPSTVPNNYPLSYFRENVSPKNTNLTTYTSTTVADKYSIYNDFKQNTTPPYYTGWQSSQQTYNRIPLDTLIRDELNYASAEYGSTPDSLKITIPFGKYSQNSPTTSSTVYFPNNWATILPNTYVGTNIMNTLVANGGYIPSQYTYSALADGSLKNIICEYNSVTNLCTLNFGSGNIISNVRPSDYSIVYVPEGNFTGTYYYPTSPPQGGEGPGIYGNGTEESPYTYIAGNVETILNRITPGRDSESNAPLYYIKEGTTISIDPHFFNNDSNANIWVYSVTENHGLEKRVVSEGRGRGTGLYGTVTGNGGDIITVNISRSLYPHAGGGTDYYYKFIIASEPPASEIFTVSNNTNNITIEYNYSKITQYVDIRYGVSARPGETVKWTNEYSNGIMDLMIHMDDLNETYYNKWDLIYNPSPTTPIPNTDKNTIEITHNAGESTMITLISYKIEDNTEIPVITTVDIGKEWTSFNLHIDATLGTVSAQLIPSANWSNFQEWSSLMEMPIGTFAMTGDIESMQIFGQNSKEPFKFQVNSTDVFLDTYGVIIINGSINILDWYPNNEHFKMKFSKTSAVGNSVTLGDTIYDITNDKITINDPTNDRDISIDVKDMVLEYEYIDSVWNLTISSDKTSGEVDITVPNTLVSLNGAWYFTCKYYTVTEETVKENIWEPIKGVAYGLSGIILIMLALNIILGILVWKFMPGVMELTDIVILIGTEIILFMILT